MTTIRVDAPAGTYDYFTEYFGEVMEQMDLNTVHKQLMKDIPVDDLKSELRGAGIAFDTKATADEIKSLAASNGIRTQELDEKVSLHDFYQDVAASAFADQAKFLRKKDASGKFKENPWLKHHTTRFREYFDKTVWKKNKVVTLDDGRKIDMRPLFQKIEQQQQKALRAKDPVLLDRNLQRQLSSIGGQFGAISGADDKINSDKAINLLSKRLDRADKRKAGNEIHTIRAAVYDQLNAQILPDETILPEDRVVTDTYKLQILREKVDKLASKYPGVRLPPQANKPRDFLKASLNAKGIDTSKVRTLKQAQKLATKEGIGLRAGQLSRTDYMGVLLANDPQAEKRQLDLLDTDTLKDRYNEIAGVGILKRKTPVIRFSELPSGESTVKRLYEQRTGNPLTDAMFNERFDQIKKKAPYLKDSTVRVEAWKRFAEEVKPKKTIVPLYEYEKRFKLNYDKLTGAKDSLSVDAELTPDQWVELHNVSDSKARRWLLAEPVPKIDPKTQKPKISLITKKPIMTRGNFIAKEFHKGTDKLIGVKEEVALIAQQRLEDRKIFRNKIDRVAKRDAFEEVRENLKKDPDFKPRERKAAREFLEKDLEFTLKGIRLGLEESI